MLKIYFFILFPVLLFSKSFHINYSDIELRHLDPLSVDKLFSSLDNLTTPIAQRNYIKKLIDLFQKRRFRIFLNESTRFLKKYPSTQYKNELHWLIGHTLIQEKKISPAKDILLPLANTENINIKSRVLMDLAQILLIEKNYTPATSYLTTVLNTSIHSVYRELAHAKLIHVYFIQKKTHLTLHHLTQFEILYPQSKYLPELQYLFVVSELALKNIQKAETYAKEILKTSKNINIQRVLAEIGLQKKDYQQTLEYYLPLSLFHNKYQDEALYKTALIQKMNGDFMNAHHNLAMLSKYFRHSPYHKRASEELANVNILLKNYDEALIFFLHETGYTGIRKVSALLKIAEINFLKENSLGVRRTANRIQKEFPYSSYANEALYWVGRSYMLDKQFEKSISLFDDYLIREPQSIKKDEILIFLGHSHAQLDHITEARSYFQEILNSSPNEILKRNALIGLGRSYNSTEPVRSLEFFDKVWKTWPHTTESEQALYFSGATRYNLKHNKESLDNFQQLLQSFPKSTLYAETLLAIAKLTFKLENFTDLVDLQTINTNKNKEISSEFKELQARGFFRIGEYEKALVLFQEAAKITENKVRQQELFLAEASTLRNLGRHSDAVQKYEKYLQKIDKLGHHNQPLEEIIWSEIAFSYLEINDISKATKIAETLSLIFPDSVHIINIYFKIGDDCFAKKYYQKSAQYYKKIRKLSKDPDIITAASLGEVWSMYEEGDPDTQIVLENFLATYPSHNSIPNIMEKLAMLYSKKNKTKAATLHYKLIEQYPASLEAEKSRLYFSQQLTKAHSPEEFHKAIKKTTDSGLKAKYLFKLATKFEQDHKTSLAIETYKQVHQLQDSVHGAESLFRAAILLNKKQKYQDSLRLYINIIAQYDKQYYPKALDHIIQTYQSLNDTTNAEKFRKRLIKEYPNSTEAKKWLLL